MLQWVNEAVRQWGNGASTKRVFIAALPHCLIASLLLTPLVLGAQAQRSGNPVLQGWYADPEAHIFNNEYWIYPTYSAAYNDQTFLDAFSSPDLLTWTKHEHVVDTTRVKWATRAVWAPSVIEK